MTTTLGILPTAGTRAGLPVACEPLPRRALEHAAAGAFGESTPDVRLDTLGDSPEQGLLVIGTALLAEDLAVLLLELPDDHVAQALDLFSDPG